MFNVRSKPSQLLAAAGMSLLVMWLSGCAAPQPAPSSPEIEVSAVSPEEVRRTESTGSVVRWGGTIARIDNTADGKSVVEIVSRPLRGGGRPVHNDRSAGRFIAETTDFLDPAIVKVGRDITVLGSVSSVRDGKIGEANYRFPVVAIDSYRYWKPQAASPPRQLYHWNGPHSHDPFWDDWPFPPHRRPGRYRSGASGSLSIILR